MMRGGVGVVDDVVAEVALVLEDVADDAAQEDDVGAGADGHVEIGDGAGAGEARIDVDDRGAARAWPP